MQNNITSDDFINTCFKIIRHDKILLWIILIYGSIASVFNVLLPLSIQYLSAQIMANASILPVVTITLCLVVFLLFYCILKIIQTIAFSYCEKEFFINAVENIIFNILNKTNNKSIASSILSYSELSSVIKYISQFLFTTSFMIQQIIVGMIVTAFYHVSFLVFNVILIFIIYLVIKYYFLKSNLLYKDEFNVKYKIGAHIHDLKHAENRSISDGDSIIETNKLLHEYYDKKTLYIDCIINQHIVLYAIYILSNTSFLILSALLTVKGYITMPQFLASELMFTLIFANIGNFAKSLKDIYELLNSTYKINHIIEVDKESNEKIYSQFTAHKLIVIPDFYKKLLKIIGAFFIIVVLGLAFVPWWQSSYGSGKIIAFNQEDRVQDITAMVNGRIASWFIRDGQYVKKGDKILEIADNDPELVGKLKQEYDSIKLQLIAAELSTQTSKLNYERQYILYNQGIASRKEYEKSLIEYQKMLTYENEIKAKLTQVDVKLSRQQSQIIVAPKSGYVLQAKAKALTSYVKAGEIVATFVPNIQDPAVEMYVSPNDIPLIHVGLKARVQIEGWPAIRLPGWPHASIGTFGGIVAVVDSAMSANGYFRILLKPDPSDDPWPEMKYIKQGTNVIGFINMNKVSVGYEIWRQINGFPIIPEKYKFTKTVDDDYDEK
jgi:multidrug resistance efflux pump